jgi:hypothetical protein
MVNVFFAVQGDAKLVSKYRSIYPVSMKEHILPYPGFPHG